MNIEGVIPLLVLAALVAGIVAAITAWRRREGLEADEQRGIGTLRRLYFYFGTFAYMMVASVGVVLMARFVLDELFGPTRLDRDVTRLALGLVLAVIWTPVWMWHRMRVQRLLSQEPTERTSVLRKVAAYLTLGVTAALVAQGSVELLRWLFGAKSFAGYPIAAVVVWGGLWALAWVMERQEGQPTEDTRTVRRLYLYSTATYGLTMLASGAAFVLYAIFRDAYEGAVDLTVVLRSDEGLWSDTTATGLAVALVGAGVWAVHWLYLARDDAASEVRQFYLYVLTILGGVVTVLSTTGVLLFGLLQWGFGTPDEDGAAAHFRFVPGALAPLLVGAVLWSYHWFVIQQERAAAGELPAARRIYRYVMTALGLGALAGAAIVLVPTVVGIIVTSAGEVLAGPDWWRDRMVLALTLGLLGVPVWAYHWYRAQQSASQLGADERYSFVRRGLLFGVMGIGVLAALGSVSHILFLLLNAMLEDELALDLLREAKWSMGTLTAAALIAPYYWFVLQEDWRTPPPAAERPAARKSVTLLVARDGRPLVEQLERALGVKVRVLERAEEEAAAPTLTPEQVVQLERRIAEAPGSRVLLVADEGGVEVHTYR